MSEIVPSTKTAAVKMLLSGRENLILDYNDRKASQLLGILADLLMAEAALESWTADLSVPGCGACRV